MHLYQTTRVGLFISAQKNLPLLLKKLNLNCLDSGFTHTVNETQNPGPVLQTNNFWF